MKSLNIWEILGASLTFVGSFLPWENGGGFNGHVINGVQIDIENFKYWVTGIHVFPVYDYGGLLIIFLTVAIILPALYPRSFIFIKDPILWKLLVSAILMASSLFFVSRWGVHLYQAAGSAEPPTLLIGLICVVLGSAVLLWRALMSFRGVTYHQARNAG